MEFQPVCWKARDVSVKDSENDAQEYVIDVFGKTQDGRSVCLHVPFCPYFFVEYAGPGNVRSFAEDLRVDLQRDAEHGQDVMDVSVVRRKKFYGFTNDQSFEFVRLVFRTLAATRKAQRFLSKRRGVFLYESNVDPVLRLLHVCDMESAGWIGVSPWTPVQSKETVCDLEGRARSYKDLRRVDKDLIAPLVIASFDIECVSADGSFPNPNDPGSKVIMIATCFQRYGEPEPFERHVVCLGDTKPVGPGIETEVVHEESQLFVRWAEKVRRASTDVLVGYNIWGFDMHYVFARASASKDSWRFRTTIGRYLTEPCKMIETTLKSSAYGNNEWKTFETHGILQVDVFTVIRKEHKLDSYKLDSVADHFLGLRKIDMNIHEMFAMYARGDPEDRRKIAEYCVRDTELPLKLLAKLAIVPNLVEMAKATHVPLEFLIPRGQQIKAFSQILKMARQEGYLCPTNPATKKQETYEGATVLEAHTGVHWGPVTCLDFASLYPSIMRAHNMCHSTIVLNAKYDNLPGIAYFEVDGVRFAQTKPGILPKLLEDLAVFRKEAKKRMGQAKASGDTFQEALFNGKQLAYKVSMNSVYGFCGAANGFLPCVPIAKSVTTVGRSMIEKTKGLIESHYGAKVVYGDTDSVMIDFGPDDLHECFRLGKEAAAMVTATFERPIELTFEKCYRPFILFAKKRYCGLYYTKPDAPDYVDSKGIQLVRRDNCPLVKRVSREVLDRIMYHRDVESAVDIVRKTTEELLRNEVSMDELVLSKTLKGSAEDIYLEMHHVCNKCHNKAQRVGDKLQCAQCGHQRTVMYKNSSQPHVHVACRLEQRSPGAGPKANERVPYVFVSQAATSVSRLQAERAEDPGYARENGLKIDGLYYLEHQLKSPMIQLFEQLLGAEAEARLFGDIERTYKNKAKGQREITHFFSAK
jgi:DNA polymerase delta subunit 1